MKSAFTLAQLSLLLAGLASAEVRIESLDYTADGRTMKGFLALPEGDAKGPAVLVFPEWRGLDDYAKRRARELAELGYAALAVDMYGDGKTAADDKEAAALAGALREGDRTELRKRAAAALDALKKHPRVDPARTAAIGYCFGGTVALELARAGGDLKGVVSFHGGLGTKKPAEKETLKAAVLVLHGADDPTVPEADVKALQEELRQAGADWQLVFYGNAVHSFSNPGAGDEPGKPVRYNARADRRSWALMKDFLAEVLLKR